MSSGHPVQYIFMSYPFYAVLSLFCMHTKVKQNMSNVFDTPGQA